ncbi:MAG: hypothetical protein HQL63_13955 [Magnetococcales bacterium]|nr:hypothetical protein [Magnetococcales bacterium]MBF0322275.1 hypothetical protein [Magnetococcales bacterium]
MYIGIDFDNTLVDYDHLFAAAARVRGWLRDTDAYPGKPALRDALRARPEGEDHWQEMQVEVYAHNMARARLAEGAERFIRLCRSRGVPVCIISHKTRFAARDPHRTDLRQAAWHWMEAQGFFADTGLGFCGEDIDFVSTRGAKLTRLAERGCTHFIDDLAEVLSDPNFPRATQGILYCPVGALPEVSSWPSMRSWHDIMHHMFNC